MEKVDLFYDRINGGYFAIVAIIVSMILSTISMALYQSVDPMFSMSTNWVSDLATGPYGYIAIIQAFLFSILMLPFFLYLARFLEKKGVNKLLAWIVFTTGFIMSLGILFCGVFPLKQPGVLNTEHVVAAFIYFYGALFFWILLGISEYINPEISRAQAIIAFITVFFWILFVPAVTLLFLNPEINQNIVKSLQWLATIVASFSFLELGIYTVKKK